LLYKFLSQEPHQQPFFPWSNPLESEAITSKHNFFYEKGFTHEESRRFVSLGLPDRNGFRARCASHACTSTRCTSTSASRRFSTLHEQSSGFFQYAGI
jgi:hypothetical protein